MLINDVLNLVPPHSAEDSDKVAAIASSLVRDGWQGAPLVVWQGCLITGSHRFEALSMVQDALTYRFDVPTVELDELLEMSGGDVDDLDGLTCEEVWTSGVLLDISPAIAHEYGIQF